MRSFCTRGNQAEIAYTRRCWPGFKRRRPLQNSIEPAGTDDVDLEGEKEMPLWEADWDDEDQGTDFAQKLKAELAKASSQMEAT